jgi:hypothetical protein
MFYRGFGTRTSITDTLRASESESWAVDKAAGDDRRRLALGGCEDILDRTEQAGGGSTSQGRA